MLQVTSREFRNKQASLLDAADQGEQVVIRHKGKRSYLLMPIYDSDITITPEFEQKIEEARRQYKNRETITCNTKEELHSFWDSL